MQSPFPGMDPYLEDPSLWPDVHHELLSVARELLHRQLRPQYHVRVEERVYSPTKMIRAARRLFRTWLRKGVRNQ